jgi:hypothetical protein
MTMSTQTLDEAGRTMTRAILIDTLQIFNVGDTITTGAHVSRELTPVGDPISGLVQTVTLESAVEGRVAQGYSIKVSRGTALEAGQVIKVVTTRTDQELVGLPILVDTISKNGLAMIRKGTGITFETVNQEGKS